MSASARWSRPKRALIAPLVLVAALAVVALAAPILSPHDPRVQPDIVALKYQSPSLSHPFGTDAVSRDVFSRVLYGARVSLTVASISVAVALLVGTCYGAFAAFAGGAIDRWLMRALDVLLSLPRVLLLLAVSALWNRPSTIWLVLLLGLTGWYGVARVVRTQMLAQLGREYVLAAQAAGVRRGRLFTRHLLPHLVPVLAVYASLGVAHTIGLEAGLSFLGFGVQPPTASWGTIMQEGSSVASTSWWLTAFPGFATLIAVVACNWLGDALRDVFAPEQVPA